MDKRFEEKMRIIFNEGIEELIMPHFDKMYENFDKMYQKLGRYDEDFEDVKYRLDSIERKLDVEIERNDEHSDQIKKLQLQVSKK